MANNIKLAVAVRNALLDGIATAAGNSGKVRIYSGSQPANADASIGAATLLAELTCNATLAPAASNGVLTLNSITQDSSADATGTAAWFRLWKADGTTPIIDGTVGTSACDLNLNTVSLVSGGAVSCTSFTLTAPNA